MARVTSWLSRPRFFGRCSQGTARDPSRARTRVALLLVAAGIGCGLRDLTADFVPDVIPVLGQGTTCILLVATKPLEALPGRSWVPPPGD
jgi:hypothetical protein